MVEKEAKEAMTRKYGIGFLFTTAEAVANSRKRTMPKTEKKLEKTKAVKKIKKELDSDED